MDSTREIKIGGDTYLLVSVPKDATYITREPTMGGKNSAYYCIINGKRELLFILTTKYKLIGRASELTEDDWDKVVEKNDYGWVCYDNKDGFFGRHNKSGASHSNPATLSGLSLLSSNSMTAEETVILKLVK